MDSLGFVLYFSHSTYWDCCLYFK